MKNNKGFTLAELLIVVAIIAVLVAISIPIFSAQLENSRETTDAANIRSAYAEVAAAALSNPNKNYTIEVNCVQIVAGWQTADTITDIAGVKIDNFDLGDTLLKSVTVGYSKSTNGSMGTIYFLLNGDASHKVTINNDRMKTS